MDFDERIKRMKPDDYGTDIRILLNDIYKSMPYRNKGNFPDSIYHRVPEELPDLEAALWGHDTWIPLDEFQDKEKAIDEIKKWMKRGGVYLSHFNTEYTHLILTRDQITEKYLKKARAKAKEAT